MVKSKRTSKAKEIKKSVVLKKDKSKKITFVETVKSIAAEYSTIYVLSINNIRTSIIKQIREEFSDSKIVFGRKRLLSKALEENPLADKLIGNEALLFTERSVEDVREALAKYKSLEFARTGSVCRQTVSVPAQPLKPFNADLTATLRDLGMPVELRDGVIILTDDYKICTRGEQLTNTMTRLLKFFNVKITEFSVDVTAIFKGELTTFDKKSQDEIDLNEKVDCLEVRSESADDHTHYFTVNSVNAAMECE